VLKLSPPVTVQSDVSCGDTIKVLGSESFEQIPVVGQDGLVMTIRLVNHSYHLYSLNA
jgi:predicted transcriptional regulator